MALVRDIQERGSSSSNAPPRPPSLSAAAGFPAIPHRSQRISAFKRARQESKTAPIAGGTNEPPVVRATFNKSDVNADSSLAAARDRIPGAPATDVAGILASVQGENEAKVKRMSERERQDELEELEMQLPKSVLDMLRARLQKREGDAGISDHEGEGGSASESSNEVESEVEEEGEMSVPDRDLALEDRPAAKPKVSFNPLLSFESGPSLPDRASVSQNHASVLDASPADATQNIHDRYFPNESLEQPGLEWIQKPLATEPHGSAASSAIARFDLSGNILTDEAARALPVTRGLHHHGNEAGRAGYTLSEVLMLSSSTYVPQRVMMLGLLGKIVAKLGQAAVGPKNLGVTIEDGRKSAFLLACGILGSKEKNLGLLRESIVILLAVLDTSRAVEVVSLTSLVELGSVLTRVEDLLEEPISTSRLSAPSILQLVSCLDVSAATSTVIARAVSQQVPQLVANFILALHWPDLGRNSPVLWEIALAAMSVLRECTERHRDMAISFASKNVYTSLLKFLALPPWETRASGEDPTGYSYELVAKVLELLEGVARYGLQGLLVTSSGAIFMSIGAWIQGLPGTAFAASDAVARIASAYFALARTWTVAATDPHSMGTDHELIWSQVEGYAWVDEALHSLSSIWDVESGDSASSSVGQRLTKATMDMLAAWTEAVKLNTIEPTVWTDRIRKVVTRIDVASWAAKKSAELSLSSPAVLDIVDSWARLASQLKVQSGLIDLGSNGGSLEGLMASASGRSLLAHDLLTGRRDIPQEWAKSANILLSAARHGEEHELLKVVDVMLDLDWKSDTQSSLGHRHGLYILRPFYQCAILPSLHSMLSPRHPVGKLMKVTTSLKVDLLAEAKGGLPLPPDWVLRPLSDQLRPTTSLAFKQVPPAWEASPIELTQASLAMARLLLQSGGIMIDRSRLLFNLMKVFMLELAADPEEEEESRVEIFRDSVVSSSMSTLTRLLLSPGTSSSETSLETISEPFLAPATTFFQWYSDFLELYQSISFSDRVFGQLLLPPLGQGYPVDYRRLFWSEQTGALRALRLSIDQVPLEYGSVTTYFRPPEQDREVLAGYLTALAKGMVTAATHEFLYALAIWHVANAIWLEGTTLSAKQVRGTLDAAIWEDIVTCDCGEERSDFGVTKSKTDNDIVQARRAKLAAV